MGQINPDTEANSGYRWVSKDPVIDLVMSLIKRSGLSFGQIEERCGVTWQTLRAWERGKTKRPHHTTVTFVLGALGYEYGVIDKVTRQLVETVSEATRGESTRRPSAEVVALPLRHRFHKGTKRQSDKHPHHHRKAAMGETA
jgi:hypothetical protein